MLPQSPPELRGVLGPWAAQPERGVIFDFNGTLSDDEPLLEQVYTGLVRDHLGWAISAAEYYARLAGRSDREIAEIAVAERAGGDPALTERILAGRRERYWALAAQYPPIRPATAELVRRLAAAGVRIAIVTGAERPDVEFVLAASPIAGLIPVVVAEEDVSRGKPDPEGFLAGLRGLGLPPGQVVAFEDSVHGIRAARAAGLRCIAVAGTLSRDVLAAEADAVVDQLGPELLGPGWPAP